ncbi:hypothetical protein LEP1GSC005_1263 [Leptospira santarosai str. ST188]|nr:hypothetical protein LEP1GSC005_1263 [Leptospira santarosai str. ST188]
MFSSFLCSWPLSVSWECGSFSKNDSTEIYPEIGWREFWSVQQLNEFS